MIASSLLIHPNPSSQIAFVSISFDQDSEVRIELQDVQGRVIKNIAEGNFEGGNHHLDFSLEDLSAGMYYASVATKDQVTFEKILKQ